MKKITSFLLLLVLSAVGYNAKAQKNLLDLVPQDALFVGTLHAESIEKKVGWQKLSEYSVVEEALRMSSTYIGGSSFEILRSLFFQKPQEKGIDLGGNSYFFAEKAGDHRYYGMAFKLTDPAAFKAAIEKSWGADMMNSLQLKNQYAILINGNLSIAWQKDHAFICYVYLPYNREEDSETLENKHKLVLDNYTDKIFNLEAGERYSNFSKFIEWEKTVRDAGLWLDYSKAVEPLLDAQSGVGSDKQFAEAMKMMMAIYGDVYMGSDISFENGQIISETRTYMSPEAINLTTAAASKKIDPRVLKYIDGEKAAFYTTMTLNAKEIYEGWKKLLQNKAGNMKNLVSEVFGIFEIFLDEKAAFELFKGDIFYAFNGIRNIESTETDYVYNEDKGIYDEVKRKVTRQRPVLVFGLSYGNKENIMKFIRIIKGTGFLTEEKKNLFSVTVPGSPEQLYIKLDKGLLIISNDSDRLIKNKKYKPLSKTHQQHIKSDWQTLFFSPVNIINMALSMAPSSNNADKELVEELRKSLGDMWLHSYRPKASDTYIRQEFSFDFTKKDENSLKLMFEFMNKIYQSTLKGI